MSNARLLLIILLCASPAVLLLDRPMTPGLIAGVAAGGLAIVAVSMRPVEMAFFLAIGRPAAALLAVPALWMLIQVLPVNLLAHPNWQSAEAALGRPIGGAISVDIGASVVALGQYLTIVAVGFWSCAVAVDRQRGEWIMFALVAATASISLLVIAMGLFGPTPIDASTSTTSQAVDCVAMGLIVAGAAALRTVERYETRHSSPHRSVRVLAMTFAACVAAFLASVAALLVAAPGGVSIAAGYGVAAFAAVVAIRRLGMGRWGVAGIVVPAVVLAIVLAVNSNLRAPGLSLAFAAGASPSSLSMTERILADAPWQGTGAGTFAAVAPIYRDVDAIIPSSAPTAAATIAIELGDPLCWFIITAMVGAFVILFRSTLRRGRDSFYAAAGAACLVALLFLFFVNAGVLGTAAAMIAAATLGLALAQSKSRTVGDGAIITRV